MGARTGKRELERIASGTARYLAHAVDGARVVCLGLALLGCAAYKPALHLPHSPRTIDAILYVDALQDVSPAEDRQDPGDATLSQTSAASMDGELAVLVTRALRADLSASSVFRGLALDRQRADLVLAGHIRRFHGEVALPTWLTLPGLSPRVQAFWGLIQAWAGEVDLELTLARPDGVTIGTYRGTSRYQEAALYDHHYWAAALYPAHARLNEAFTKAVQEITEQMLRDEGRILAALGRAVGAHD